MGTLSVDKILKTSTGAATFTLPATDGTAGQSMVTDGSGQLSLGNPTLPTDSVTATQIAAGAVGTSEIAALAVTASEIAATTITPAQMADSAFLANRNYIINGNFEVAQRGTSFSPTNGSGAGLMYTLDRWYGYRSTSTAIMQQISDGTSPDGFRCHARMGRTDSTTDAGYFIIGQQVETRNACSLAGQTVCLSMWAKKHANFSGDWGIYVTTGTGSDESAWDSIGGGWTGAVTAYSSTTVLSDVTTSWVKRSISFSVAAGVKEIAIKHHFSSFSGASVTNDYVEVAGMQLEIGSVATPFEYKSYGQELQTCERYYQTYGMGFHAFGISGTTIDSQFSFRTIMRASPSVTLLDTTPTFQQLNVANRVGTSSSITTSAQGPDGTGLVRVDGFSSVGSNSVCMGNQTTPIFGFAAEL